MAVSGLKGIVIKEIPVGESNKHIVVLTKEQGKLLLFAKGARNQKSKLLAGTQLFSFSEFQIFEGKGFASVTQADILESFYDLRNDIERLAYATYFLELTEKTVPAGMEAEEVLELVLKTLVVLCKSDIDVRLAARIFEIKILQILGFMGDTQTCFDRKISIGCQKALNFVTEKEIKDIYNFRVSDEVLYELTTILKTYIALHINEKFKTLDFAESL